jgi:hypothetical protein
VQVLGAVVKAAISLKGRLHMLLQSRLAALTGLLFTFVVGCSAGTATQTGSGAASDADGGTAASEEGGTNTGSGADGGGAPGSAPLDWKLDGVATSLGKVSLLGPKGWTQKASATELIFKAPAAKGTCEIDVLAPVAAASGEAAQRSQLLGIVKSAFSGHTVTDPSGNAAPTVGVIRGAGPQGYTLVGFDLLIDQGKVRTHAYMAVFGSTAVPFATVWDPANGSCLTSIEGEVQESQLLHTLSLAGATPTDPNAKNVVGEFSLSATSVVELYSITKDGKFIFTLTTDFSGDMKTTQSTGTWSVAGDVMSFFPVAGGPSGSAPYSEYVRVYQSSNPQTAGGYDTFFCLLGAGDPKTAGTEACFQK